jgi:MscS family membrane protein
LIMAGHLGIDVLGVTAALGLTGFAIALALKDTITNIVSGLVIMISRPFAIGDRIDVPSLGVWADVVDIGIRSSTVVTRDNRTVIVPNSAVVDNAVTNYSRPDTSYRLQVDIGLGPAVDMRLAQEAIRTEVRGCESVLPERPVDVWFTGFSEYTNTVRVRWWVQSYAQKRSSTDAVSNAIVDVTSREGIAMPDPHLTLDGNIRMDPDLTADHAP